MSDMSEEKELLILISNKIDKMSLEIKDINTRMDRLEGKVDDMHRFTPFVEWLEKVGKNLSKKFRWLKGHKDPPELTSRANHTPALLTHATSDSESDS